jgi:hypothetical protein
MYWSKIRSNGKIIAILASYEISDNKTVFLMEDEKEFHATNLLDYGSHDFYYSPDGIIYYSPKFSEIIFAIDKNGVKPAIGVKNLKIPSKEIRESWAKIKNVRERIEAIDESGYFIESVNIYETDKYITFSPVRDFFSDILLYNKQTESVCKIDGFNLFSSIGISGVSGSTGKEIFGVIHFNSENEIHKRILDSQEELKNWSDDDNAVIVIFKLEN